MAFFHLLSVVLVGFSIAVSRSQGSCPKNWIYLEGSCYKFSSQHLTWNAAKTTCENMGFMLAVVDSKEKQKAITTLLKGRRIWIGLYRDPKDTARWLWVDQSRLSFANWARGEPNNAGGRFEGCGLIWPNGRWNDGQCSAKLPYVCQMNACSGISVQCKDQEMVIAVPRSVLQHVSCSPTKYRGRRELSEDVVLFSAKGPIHPSREKREKLEQGRVYVKRGSAQVPVKKSADGSTA